MPVGGSGVSNFAYSAGVAAGVSAVNRMGSAGVRADFSGNPIAALFASGEEGAWYDPSDLSTMFTTNDGSTLASVDGPVGRIEDKSGNGNHATQATAAARPTLRQTAGGLYYLEFDGVDDHLISGSNIGISGDFSGTAFVVGASAYTGTAFNGYFAINPGNDNLAWVMPMRARKPSFDIWTARVEATTALDGNPHLHTLNKTPGTLTDTAFIRVDGAQIATDTDAKTPNLTNAPLQVGRSDGTRHLDCDIYGLVILGRNVVGAERGASEAWLAAKAGVTL